jgi:hypothetical protein
MINTSFYGMSGRVAFNARGEMLQSISVVNFLRDGAGPMHGSVAGVFDSTSGQYSPTDLPLTWPGGGAAVPTDSPTNEGSGIIRSQLVIALVLGSIMLLMLGLLAYLLYRNAGRAKEIFMDVMSFEMLLALEVCLEVRVTCQSDERRGSALRVQVWDICGDTFFVIQVQTYRNKSWLSSLYIPYMVVFILAASVSLVSILTKALLFVGKLRTRAKAISAADRSSRVSRISIGGVQVSAQLADNAQVAELKSRFDSLKVEHTRYLCYILLLLLEDIPMGSLRYAATLAVCAWRDGLLLPPSGAAALLAAWAVVPCVRAALAYNMHVAHNVRMSGVLNTIYLYRSIVECVESALVHPSSMKTSSRVRLNMHVV